MEWKRTKNDTLLHVYTYFSPRLQINFVSMECHLTLIFNSTRLFDGNDRPKNHLKNNNKNTINKEYLVNNTATIACQLGYNNLQIIEAILIKELKPNINAQTTISIGTLKII